MRGLLKAGVLLTPALVGAVALGDSIASATITLHLPESDYPTTSQDLTFQFDILESSDACGYGNVTIDGQNLAESGSGSLTMDQDVVDATWNFTCVAWNGQPQEQLINLNVDNINGQPIKDVGFTLQFQQVAPVWISDIEGDAIMTRLHSIRQGEPKKHCDNRDDNDEIDLDAEMAELDFLKWQVAELSHEIRAKEQRLAIAFGWDRRIKDCDSLKCVIGTVVHKVKGAAKSVYGRPGPHGPHGPRPHGHGSEGKHREGEEPHFPQHPGHGNHTGDGPHPPPPPHHGVPHFPHPPPFCKCAPPPPPHGGHYPPHDGEHPPPPPPGFGPPPPPHHGEHPPPPPPPGPHSEKPDLINALLGFIHPGPPTPQRWEHTNWKHEGKPHGKGHHHFEELEIPQPHEGKPHPQGHDDTRPSDGIAEPDVEAEKQDNEAGKDEPVVHPEDHEGLLPLTPLDTSAIDEPELRRDYGHGPPPHDGPHDGPNDGPHDGSHDGSHDGPHDGPHGGPHNGPSPPPPHPHGPPPHGPIWIHLASALVSLILLGVFGSVLYQRYVRKSIRTPRRRRGDSSAPWYKKMCFGPHYYELSEDEEKEAMLRGSDEDSDDEDDNADVVARDIGHFRTAADVVSEMVAVEDGRMMMAHSPQPSSQVMPAPLAAAAAAAPTAQQIQTSSYVPTNAVPMAIDPAAMEAMAAMFPDLHDDVGEMSEELPAYQEADRDSDADASELASSMVSDGYRPGCSGSSYTPSESGSQGADDILGDTKN